MSQNLTPERLYSHEGLPSHDAATRVLYDINGDARRIANLERFDYQVGGMKNNPVDLKTAPIMINGGYGKLNKVLKEGKRYPKIIMDAIDLIYREFNESFKPLINENKEGENDYKYCFDEKGNPINFFIQIDMTSLPQSFFDDIEKGKYSLVEVYDIIKSRTFEIENSLAAYELMFATMSKTQENGSSFKSRFIGVLNSIKQKSGKNRIVLSTNTRAKYGEILFESGFRIPEEIIPFLEKSVQEQALNGNSNRPNKSPELVKKFTGFDDIISPDELVQEVQGIKSEGKDELDFLVYFRNSLDKNNLRKPKGRFERSKIDSNIFNDDTVREASRRVSLTFNIDNPNAINNSDRFKGKTINDTKMYQPQLGMGYEISSFEDIYSGEFISALEKFRGKKSNSEIYNDIPVNNRLNADFRTFLIKRGINPTRIDEGKLLFRVKPAAESYGAYGHESGSLGDSSFMKKIAEGIKQWNSLIIQDSMPKAHFTDEDTGTVFLGDDRNFFGTDAITGKTIQLGSVTNLVPKESRDGKNETVHGGYGALWIENDLAA